MACIQCGKEPKYKCPNCSAPYCSVVCYKAHKNTDTCVKPPDPPKEVNCSQTSVAEYKYPTDDTVSTKLFELLRESTEIKNCLQNPAVRKMIEELDMSPCPDVMIGEYMQDPIFLEFADACLNVIRPPDKNE